MVTLVEGAPVPQNPDLEVAEGGDYEDTAIVPCRKVGEAEIYVYHEAHFIATGKVKAQD